MASYATEKQVRVRVKDLTKREIDSDIIEFSITRASNIIDSHLCRYYDITGFTSSIGVLNSICIDLAASYIMGTIFQDYDQSASAWETKLHNMGMQIIRSIQDNVADIPTLARIGV